MPKIRAACGLFLAFLSFSALADRPVDISHGHANDSFSIRGIDLGDVEADVLSHLGEPISKVKQPPQFGDIEIEYRYQGLVVHLTDGSVASLVLHEGPFKLDNGILIGMTRSQVEKHLGESFALENIGLQFGESECYVYLYFSEKLLVEVKQYCLD